MPYQDPNGGWYNDDGTPLEGPLPPDGAAAGDTGDDWFASNAPPAAGANTNDIIARVRALGPNADLRPLAAELGLTRDQLAEMRDTAGRGLLNDLRSRAGAEGLRVDMSDAPVSDDLASNGYDVGRTLDALRARSASASQGPMTLSGMVASPSGVGPQPARPQLAPFAFDPSKLGETPGFKFDFDQAMRAIDRRAAAKGKSFTNDTREELAGVASGLASRELGNEFGRQATTYGINADRSDVGFNQDRALTTDAWSRDDSLFNRDRATLQDSRAWDSDLWNRGQVETNSAWQRGNDVWSMGRTDRNDAIDANTRLSDLILARRPRPGGN